MYCHQVADQIIRCGNKAKRVDGTEGLEGCRVHKSPGSVDADLERSKAGEIV